MANWGGESAFVQTVTGLMGFTRKGPGTIMWKHFLRGLPLPPEVRRVVWISHFIYSVLPTPRNGGLVDRWPRLLHTAAKRTFPPGSRLMQP